MSRLDLTVGVPGALLSLEPTSGHGKVWFRVLTELKREARVVPLERRGARRRRIDVVLANGHDELPLTDAPLVVQIHECGWFTAEQRALIGSEFLELIAPRTERAVRSATKVITPSEAARHDLLSTYELDPGRVHAIHHGLDPVFRPEARGGRELVMRASGGPPAPYVLYAATLVPRKNLSTVREAVAAIAAEGFPHVLAIAGHPPPDRMDASELEREAAAELDGTTGRVAMLGAVSDGELASLMAGAEAFCLPSLYEGFGLTALEAMGSGAPVIVSDRGALPEVVGDAGLVVPPSAEAVANALRRVLGDPELGRSLRARGLARARQFAWQRTAASWLEVLRAAVGQPYTRARR